MIGARFQRLTNVPLGERFEIWSQVLGAVAPGRMLGAVEARNGVLGRRGSFATPGVSSLPVGLNLRIAVAPDAIDHRYGSVNG
jgi:hypothetical protein